MWGIGCLACSTFVARRALCRKLQDWGSIVEKAITLDQQDAARMIKYAENMPQGCPLPNAIDCSSRVYKICKSTPPSAKDFMTHAEKNIAKDAAGAAACMRHGLSVFPTFESCDHLKRFRPRLGKYIATAELRPEHGKIADTPNGENPRHQTWWPYVDVAREEIFAVVDISGGTL